MRGNHFNTIFFFMILTILLKFLFLLFSFLFLSSPFPCPCICQQANERMEGTKQRSYTPTNSTCCCSQEYQSVLLELRNGASSKPSAPHTNTAYSSALPHAATSSAATRRYHRHISTLPNTVAATPEATTFYSGIPSARQLPPSSTLPPFPYPAPGLLLLLSSSFFALLYPSVSSSFLSPNPSSPLPLL